MARSCASIDLGDVTPTAGGPPVAVPVRLTALDPRVQIVDFAPRSVNVRVDQVVIRPMTVTVERGTRAGRARPGRARS